MDIVEFSVSMPGWSRLETQKRVPSSGRLTRLRGFSRGGRSELAPTGGHGVAPTMRCEVQSRKTAGVPPSGFEPLISTLKGSCPRPLDDGGAARTGV